VYPFDAGLGVAPGRTQLDGQQAAAKVGTERPYGEAHTLWGALTGVGLGSERMPTVSPPVAEGLPGVDVAPSRDELERRIAWVAGGRLRRPVLVLGIDGADVPTRPASARGRRPGHARQRARRARWKGPWREAKGCRLALMAGARIGHVLSWHQVQNEAQLGEALQQVKDAGVIPDEKGRLCVVGAGAAWLGQHGQSLVPHARQVLEDSHCVEDLHGVAKAHYGAS
jgi:hypothetical protein